MTDVATLHHLANDGPPLRLRTLVALSGFSAELVREEVRLRRLRAIRRGGAGRTSPYMVERAEARRWLRTMGFVV